MKTPCLHSGLLVGNVGSKFEVVDVMRSPWQPSHCRDAWPRLRPASCWMVDWMHQLDTE